MATQPFDYSALLASPGAPPPAAYYNPYANMGMDWSQGNPAYAMKQNRGYFANWGAQQTANLEGQQGYEQGNQARYGAAMDQAAGQLGNTPGYTDQEMQNIANPAAYGAGVTTPDQYASLNPTQAESTAMTGNPGQGAASYSDTVNDVFGNPYNLAPQQPYYQALHDAYTGTQAGVNAAVNSPGLKLQLDPGKYIMSNQEVQGMENQASQAVNLESQSQMDAIRRGALAAGNADPMALAALQQQYNTTAQKNAADAVTSAQIQAEDAQRQTEMNYAQAALGAGQTQAQMQMGGALNTGQMGENVAQTAEMTNLNAAQWLAGQQLNSAGTEAGLQDQADQQAAARAAGLYGIRQGNAQYQQGQTFGQNFQTQSQLSNLYANAANARMYGQNNFLNWATGQSNTALQANQNLNNEETGVAQTTFPQMNSATGQWGQYDLGKSGQGFGANFAAALGKSVGSGFGAW